MLPRFLPLDWKGPLALLVMVFALSSFLDNIAAALIGGAMVRSLFRSVHIGYIAAIVAASNARSASGQRCWPRPRVPLTALALEQGGYDWGILAYSVGFGGSMNWFGSSAGVAITTMFSRRSVRLAVAEARMARRGGLRRGFLRAVDPARLASEPDAP